MLVPFFEPLPYAAESLPPNTSDEASKCPGLVEASIQMRFEAGERDNPQVLGGHKSLNGGSGS